MKTTSSKIQSLCIVMLFGWVGWSFAASPPERINIQGVLRDINGNPGNGSLNMRFDFYDADGGPTCSGGTLLLTDQHLAGGTGAARRTRGYGPVRRVS